MTNVIIHSTVLSTYEYCMIYSGRFLTKYRLTNKTSKVVSS